MLDCAKRIAEPNKNLPSRRSWAARLGAISIVSPFNLSHVRFNLDFRGCDRFTDYRVPSRELERDDSCDDRKRAHGRSETLSRHEASRDDADSLKKPYRSYQR